MKKYDFLVLTLFLVLVAVLSFPTVFAHLPLSGKVIYIDPGHGGVDPGSVVGSVLEKDINLNISKFLQEELTRYGATVFLTREGDYDLGHPNATYRKKSDFDGRIKKINESSVDFYLSIHLNILGDTKYSGPQVFYNHSSEWSKRAALFLQESLNKDLNGDREVKLIPSSTYMYSKVTKPGILIECGFLSNSHERNLLVTEDYQRKIAQSIADAFKDFDF